MLDCKDHISYLLHKEPQKSERVFWGSAWWTDGSSAWTRSVRWNHEVWLKPDPTLACWEPATPFAVNGGDQRYSLSCLWLCLCSECVVSNAMKVFPCKKCIPFMKWDVLISIEKTNQKIWHFCRILTTLLNKLMTTANAVILFTITPLEHVAQAFYVFMQDSITSSSPGWTELSV